MTQLMGNGVDTAGSKHSVGDGDSVSTQESDSIDRSAAAGDPRNKEHVDSS